jgi:hypothetical protein
MYHVVFNPVAGGRKALKNLADICLEILDVKHKK